MALGNKRRSFYTLLQQELNRGIILFFIAAILIIFCTTGCTPVPEWARTLGGNYQDVALSVTTTNDGYIFSGYTKSFGAGGEDVWLFKTDFNGKQIWQQSYGGTNNDRAVSMKPTSDGGYILAGCTYSFSGNSQKSDAYLIKTSANGDLIWSKSYGRPDFFEEIFGIQETSDGGFILAGTRANTTVDIYIISTDINGEELWTKTIGFSDQSWANDIICTSDGGYLLTGIVKADGYNTPVGEMTGDIFLLKIDSSGEELWFKNYEGSLEDEGYRVVQSLDGGYVIAGTTHSYGAGKSDLCLIKTDVDGEMTWFHTYGGTGSDYGRCIVATDDGGFLVGGAIESSSSFDMYIVKADATGKEIWTKTYGGNKDLDVCNDIVPLDSGEFILAGATCSFGDKDGDALLVKISSDGQLVWKKMMFIDNFLSLASYYGFEKKY